MKLEGKLELTWVGKNEEIKLEPRILVEDKSKSYGDPNSQNMLIHGDNLLALKALEKDFAGKIKCIYIDPPYNTGSAFEYYDDGLEHSQWLCMMKPRLELLKRLLSEQGVLYIQIDDIECAYLKVLCDEIFGRSNFITTIAVKMSTPSGVKLSHRDKKILKIKEFILVYAKNKDHLTFKPQYQPKKEWDSYYEWYVDKDGNDVKNWKVYPLKEILQKEGIFNTDINDPKFKNFYLTNADKIWQRGRNTSIPTEILELSKNNWDQIFEYSNDKDSEPQYCYKGRRMAFLSKVIQECTNRDGSKINDIGTLICDFWDDISTAALFAEGKIDFPNGKKPETLIARILDLSTNPGDYILDSFLGSGSTCAVAQKMDRKWIGIEMGDHAYTHAKKRIDSIIKGEDQTGISKAIGWQGGGGYKFYELAESLLVKNAKLPIYQINPNYTFEMMCEAICKIEGFDYKPEGSFHGKSSENRFIHITTEFVNAEYIKNLSKELSSKQSLLIYSTKFATDLRLPDNIVVKKIPKDLLKKCKFESEVR